MKNMHVCKWHVIDLNTFPDSHLWILNEIWQRVIEFIVPGDWARLCHGDKHHCGNQMETTRIPEHSNLGALRAAGVYMQTHTGRCSQMLKQKETSPARKMERKQDGMRTSGQRSKCEVSDVCVSHQHFSKCNHTFNISPPQKQSRNETRERSNLQPMSCV